MRAQFPSDPIGGQRVLEARALRKRGHHRVSARPASGSTATRSWVEEVRIKRTHYDPKAVVLARSGCTFVVRGNVGAKVP